MAEYTVKEKMEHAIAEAAASFMTNEYVVKGAQLKCTLGSAPSLLNLPLCHGFYATGHPIIHSMDNKPMINILPFGTCPVLGGPCVPAPIGPWLNTHEKTMIADAAPGGPLYPAVTMKSFLVCALGGLIEPKKSGQEYKTPGAATTLEGAGSADSSGYVKGPANTGRYDRKTLGPEKIASNTFKIGVEGLMLRDDLSNDLSNISFDFSEMAISAIIGEEKAKKIHHKRFPLLYEQNKTQWCYAVAAYIMCERKIKSSVEKDIRTFTEKMGNELIHELDSFTSIPAKDIDNINANSKYFHTDKGVGKEKNVKEKGFRSVSTLTNLPIGGLFEHDDFPGKSFYYPHPIQAFLIHEMQGDVKSNVTDWTVKVIKYLTDSSIDFSVKRSAKQGKHTINDLTVFADWFKNGSLDLDMVRENLTEKVSPDTPVIASVGRRASNGLVDGGHSILITKIEENKNDFLQSKFVYLDTLDGIEGESTRRYTLKQAFEKGMSNFGSVLGDVYIYGTYFFI